METPVILLCYNRPRHTAAMLEALEAHNVRDLIVFADAPKKDADLADVAAVRKLLEGIRWTRPELVFREENRGLARSVVAGVNYAFERADRMILLEDDCIPQRHFFDFMARALDRYAENERVFGVNGYTVPLPPPLLARYPYDAYFYPRIGSWGWGTWKRAWRHYDPDLLRLCKEALDRGIDLTQGGADIPVSLHNQLAGAPKDVWTLNWVVSVYLKGGYYVYPTVSHIENIGCDGTGVNSGATDLFASPVADRAATRFPPDVVLDYDMINNYNRYFGGPVVSPPRQPEPESRPRAARPRQELAVVHINTHDILGGAAKVGWRLAAGARRMGHRAEVLAGYRTSPDEHAHSFALDVDRGVRERCLAEGLLYYDFQGSHKLLNHPLVREADVIHLHNLHGDYFNPFTLQLLCRHKPVVWTLHDMQAITGHCAHSFACERWQAGCGACPDLSVYPALQADTTSRLWRDKKLVYDRSRLHVVTPSRWLGEKVEKSVLAGHPLDVIPNGVDTAVFRPHGREGRRRFDLPENAVLIGCVAHAGVLANPWKGGVYTLAAIDALRKRFPDCFFLNIGAGTPSSDPHIINIPNVADEEELARLYSLLDIFLFTSLAENCPLVILEAMACGVPVASFATGGVPELVRDGLDGCVVPYRDLPALVAALAALVPDPARRAACGRNARERAETVFRHDRIVSAYLYLYERAIEERKSAPPLPPLPEELVPDVVKSAAFLAFNRADAGAMAEAALLTERGEGLFASDPAGAEQAFLRASALDRTSAVARNNLGVLSWGRGDARGALGHLCAAFDLNPNDRQTVANIVEILESLGQRDNARFVCDSYLQCHPHDREMREFGKKLAGGGR